MKTFSLIHPRDQLVAIMDRIYAHEMTTTSGGNLSVRTVMALRGAMLGG